MADIVLSSIPYPFPLQITKTGFIVADSVDETIKKNIICVNSYLNIISICFRNITILNIQKQKKF